MNVMNYVNGFGLVLFAFFWQVSVTGIQRRVIAKIQKRVGPRWYQQFLDIFKALSKRSISHGWIYDFGVIMALGGILGTTILMPVAGWKAFPGMDNFFSILYLLAVGMLGMAMSSVGSGNPWASIGISRALTQMVGYEVPYLIVVTGMISAFHTSSISGLAAAQQTMGVLGWNAFRMPLGFIVGFIALLGMLGKKPFDSHIAPAEIASGPMVEYAGKHLGILFMLHEFMTFVEVSLFVNLFLGGGPTLVAFLIKYFLVYTLATMVSTVCGRFKIDQIILFFYKVPIVMALIQAILVIYFGLGVKIWL